MSCPLTDEYVHTRERNTLVLTQAMTGRKLENITLTENCLLPKGLPPKSQNPRKAEKRMVIVRGSGGEGDWSCYTEILSRERKSSGNGWWGMAVQSAHALDTIELYTLIVTMADAIIRVDGKCSIMCTLSH